MTRMQHLDLRGPLRDALCELLRAWAPDKWYGRMLRAALLAHLGCTTQP